MPKANDVIFNLGDDICGDVSLKKMIEDLYVGGQRTLFNIFIAFFEIGDRWAPGAATANLFINHGISHIAAP